MESPENQSSLKPNYLTILWSAIVSLLIAFAVMFFIMKNIKNERQEISKLKVLGVEAEFTANSNMISKDSFNGITIYRFLFNTPILWEDSGIEINQGDSFRVLASGKYAPAIHHIVKSAYDDNVPPLAWIGPDGIGNGELKRPVDLKRSEKKIIRSANYGKLLMQFVPIDKEKETRPDSQNVVSIGSKFPESQLVSRWAYSGNKIARLYFAVNEVPLDETMEQYYVVKEDTKYIESRGKLPKVQAAWRNILLNRYWNIWFDDNVGSLLITVEIKSKQK